jgi:hypothetical protein
MACPLTHNLGNLKLRGGPAQGQHDLSLGPQKIGGSILGLFKYLLTVEIAFFFFYFKEPHF